MTSWQRAQQRVMEAEARGSWDPPPEEQKAEPTAIAEAKQQFLRDAEAGRRLSESTLGKYKLMLRELEDFASKKGFRYLKQLDVEFLRQFRDSWKIGARTAVKKIERVRAFFRFAVESGWIEKNPAKLVRGAATIKDTQKLPFDPKEMQRIVAACRQVFGHGRIAHHGAFVSVRESRVHPIAINPELWRRMRQRGRRVALAAAA
jgi:hypothetical protein